MEWISVEQRLPEIVTSGNGNPCSQSVLVTDGTNIQVGIRWICGEKEYFLPDYREGFQEITHWMPLPNPPNSCQAGQKKNSES